MNQVESIPLDPKYSKDNDLQVFDLDAANELIPFDVAERSIVHLPAGQIGGNHSHPRTEGFFAFGEDLELHWQDEKGVTHVELMNPNSELRLTVVRPNVPHAVINKSATCAAFLIEYANGPQLPEDVTPVQVI